MNVFFDVDSTLITWDYRLRPHVREVFTQLRADGHTVYLWSGLGKRWEVVERFKLHALVADCFAKPLYRHRERLAELGVYVEPHFVVDDHAEPVEAFGGYHIPPPCEPLHADTEMLRVYAAIALHAAQHTSHPEPLSETQAP
jgi:hypothetical protein